ncbi:hypothetical protein EH11_03759 [Bacillus subtilis]|nr:hypothetical protein BS732_4216 [Bacillus subtilis MB73/2]RPJ98914.1 hypothetical protein EH11_03759 [Bacillus subtilis]CCU60982.1 hypothetical protein BSUBE1_4351 [Bacillus subtilis E1]
MRKYIFICMQIKEEWTPFNMKQFFKMFFPLILYKFIILEVKL